MFLAAKASSLMGESSSSHSRPQPSAAPPVPVAQSVPHQQPAPTHVTYVTAYQTAPYPQTHTYPPNGPPQSAGYPAYPVQGPPAHQPAFNPDYPPQYSKN